MHRRSSCALVASLAWIVSLPAQDVVSTDTALYRAQGEYLGRLRAAFAGDGQDAIEIGAQLIAYTGGDAGGERLHLVLYRGGLPGAGWKRGDPRVESESPFTRGVVRFENDWTATLEEGHLSFRAKSGDALGVLDKVERRSPTLGASPPPGALVLFDGTSIDAFANGRFVEGKLLAAGCDCKRGFGDQRIHIEFKTPFKPAARGQGRGNSGVYVQGRYECQVLDSFGLEGLDNECGGIYSIARPILNACLPPETWQTYDIVFTAARFDGDRKIADGRMTVHLNGLLVHDDVALPHATTANPRPEGPDPASLHLQDHGNPVVYRNIWVVEDDPSRTRSVVFLAGRPSHGYGAHEHHAGCMLLAHALDASGLAVKTTVIDGWPEDPAVLETADVIVCFADGGLAHPFLRHLEQLDALMARGKGMVCIHYGVEVPTGAPGEDFTRWIGGYFETDWSVNPHWHADFAALPDHPITRGVHPFAIDDEWYFHMRFRPGMESVTPILAAVAPSSTMSREDGTHSGNPFVRAEVAAGVPQCTAWSRIRPDGGRGFGFTGAHVHWNWAHDDFRKRVLNAIVWCAWLPIPERGVRSATPDLAALQANQDEAPGDGFDAAAVTRLIESFRTHR